MMESLRDQLASTQGALTERDKKFRELRADQRTWLEEKSALEAKIARLEAENMRLQGTPHTVGDASSKPEALACSGIKSPEIDLTHKGTENMFMLIDQQHSDGNETVTIKRSQLKQAEKRYDRMAEDVAEKTKLCEALKAKLAQSRPTAALELSDDEVVIRWNRLREQIRTLSQELLSKPFEISKLSDKCARDFKELSPSWEVYAKTQKMTSYLFRALIWRYILRFFEIPCRAFGRNISKSVGELATALEGKLSDAELQDWRIRTATLVYRTYPIDESLIGEVVTKLLEEISPLLADKTIAALKSSLGDVVEKAAKLSAVFDRSHFVVLMYNQPKSTLMHGFPYVANLMDMRANLTNQGLVDLMITPSLLKYETDYSVIVKADVIC
ncbi:hypothetical protein F5Y03DRAFT_349648 [Xylaria venustula]|nr:hypothetical protein F5Y03DRAFT_349648 [Xylaria venustula]